LLMRLIEEASAIRLARAPSDGFAGRGRIASACSNGLGERGRLSGRGEPARAGFGNLQGGAAAISRAGPTSEMTGSVPIGPAPIAVRIARSVRAPAFPGAEACGFICARRRGGVARPRERLRLLSPDSYEAAKES
jgi:hypothetical protein